MAVSLLGRLPFFLRFTQKFYINSANLYRGSLRTYIRRKTILFFSLRQTTTPPRGLPLFFKKNRDRHSSPLSGTRLEPVLIFLQSAKALRHFYCQTLSKRINHTG